MMKKKNNVLLNRNVTMMKKKNNVTCAGQVLVAVAAHFLLMCSSSLSDTTTLAFVVPTTTTLLRRKRRGDTNNNYNNNKEDDATKFVAVFETKTDADSSSSTLLFEPFLVGIQRDFKNRFPQYKSDITDGLTGQCIATIMFLFFACLAPAIGFGSVVSAATNNHMGVIEMVASTSLSGMLYAIFSAQPVQLIGPQGPVVAFIAALYGVSSMLQIPFLSLYGLTGIIASSFLTVFAVTSASNLVSKLTRWTDEIFSVLVSVLFLTQAVGDVTVTFVAAAAAATSATAVVTSVTKLTTIALLTLVTCATTFGTALVLKMNLPKTRYLTSSIRKNLANFAPAIGVIIGSLLARLAQMYLLGSSSISLPALQLPSEFVTSTGRSWLSLLTTGIINTNTKKLLWLTAIPAGFAAAILLYLDQNITARLVNHPRYKQRKGKRSSVLDGMHGDMLVLALLTAISSILGLPWMCGAPTRSAAHVRNLSIVSNNDDGSGSGEVIEGTIENRVTGFAIHAMIGICAICTSPRNLLRTVPKPALSGIFLYLGYTSLQGLELWDRFRGLFKDRIGAEGAKYSTVKRYKITVFTLIQTACVWTMMKVTNSRIGVISPILIALLPFIRWLVLKTKLIDESDMKLLDD